MEKVDFNIFENSDDSKELNEYIEKLKLNYYQFMEKPRGHFGRLNEIVNEHQKKEFVVVFQELIDTSLTKIQCLNEEETDIIRRWIGVNGEEYSTVEKLANGLGVSYSVADRKLKNAYEKIFNRILRGFVDLEEAVLNGDISKDEICKLPIEVLYELFPKLRFGIKYVSEKEINTIGDFINNSIDTIQRQRGIGSSTLKKLIDYIHRLGLCFKDEIDEGKQLKNEFSYVEIASDTSLSFNKKREYIKLKLLLDKLKIINEQDEIYDKKLNKIWTKKEELKNSREEILDEILKILQDSDEIETSKNRVLN